MFSNQERQIFNSILHFSDFNSINVFTRVNFNGLMKWEIFCIFFWYVLEFIVIFFILNKSYFANSSNKLVHRISEMKSAYLVFIKINNNFPQLFFSQICFDISLLLHSIDLRFIVELCGELNALNIAQTEIFISTKFDNLARIFNFADISIILKINREEMFSFSNKLSYL